MAPAEQIQSHIKKRKKLQSEKKALKEEYFIHFMSDEPDRAANIEIIQEKISNLDTAIKAINSNIKILKEYT